MLVVQSHSSACPEHTRYLQRSQLRSCQGAGPVGPTSPCHLACERGAVRHNCTQWGCTSETLHAQIAASGQGESSLGTHEAPQLSCPCCP